MTDLKPGWERVQFSELAECVNDRVDDPAKAGVGRYVGLDHLDSDSLKIRRWGAPEDVESTKLRFKPGDIIFGKRRAYQRKLAVADFEGICSAHAMVLRAKPSRVLPEFLPYLMQSDVFMDRAIAISVGSLSPTINWKELALEEFALPPLAEQLRLSSILRAATDVKVALQQGRDAACRARDSLIRHLFESGTRNEAIKITEFGRMPQSWSAEPLGERFSIQLGKMMSEAARINGAKIPYIRNANVQWNRLDLSDVGFMSFSDAEREKFSLRAGDILACEGRHVGKAALWREEIPGACYQKALHRIRAFKADLPEFVLHHLYFYSITGRFVALTGETTIPHLPAEKLRAMRFRFPSLDEQREIVDAIESFDAASRAVEARERDVSVLLRSFMPETM